MTNKRETLLKILATLTNDRRATELAMVVRYSNDISRCARLVAVLVRAEIKFGKLTAR